MAEPKTPAARAKAGGTGKPNTETKPMAGPSLSGLTEQQAKEFHDQFKVTYTAFVGLAALAHLFVIAAKPWF
jgi:light-harvesting complex 1 beta chain